MKKQNLYDLNAFDRLVDSSTSMFKGFADSFQGVVLGRNLTAINPRIFEKKFPELSFMNCGIEADNTGGYAARIQSLRLVGLGGFTNAGDVSGNKGKISLTGEDDFLKVVERESHSNWTDTELQQAQLQNINLVAQYVSKANDIYSREVDMIGLKGVQGGPSYGLLNNSIFASGGATGALAGLTPLELYNEFAALITDQWNAVNNTPEYMANRVIMPVWAMNLLTTKLLTGDAGYSSQSVFKTLQDNFPTVVFLSSARADTEAVAFTNNSEAMLMRLPLALTVGSIIQKGSFNYEVDYKYRIAGLDILESSGGRILTGLK